MPPQHGGDDIGMDSIAFSCRANCPPGTYKKDDKNCEECVLGKTYQPFYNAASCSPVDSCPDGEWQVQAPTLSSNRVCKAGRIRLESAHNVGVWVAERRCTAGSFVGGGAVQHAVGGIFLDTYTGSGNMAIDCYDGKSGTFTLNGMLGIHGMGQWSIHPTCPGNSLVCGISARFYKPFWDDTVNGVQLVCCNKYDYSSQDVVIDYGLQGLWTRVVCPRKWEFVSAVEMKRHDQGGIYADSVMNGIGKATF